jgi:hypothetical protein
MGTWTWGKVIIDQSKKKSKVIQLLEKLQMTWKVMETDGICLVYMRLEQRTSYAKAGPDYYIG